jgi:hypothetical protein
MLSAGKALQRYDRATAQEAWIRLIICEKRAFKQQQHI